MDLDFNLGAAIPSVAGDTILIQRVILNLPRNAVEAMALVVPGTRALTINTSSENGSILLAARDNGAGIEACDPEKVFEPFYTTKSDWLDVGWAICWSIIENYGDKLWPEQASNLGASFHINLPKFDPGVAQDDSALPLAGKPTGAAPRRHMAAVIAGGGIGGLDIAMP